MSYSNKKSNAVGRTVFVNESSANVDYKYGPYYSKEQAFATLGPNELDVLAKGLTVGIVENGKIREYWFKEACSSVDDLVPKWDVEVVTSQEGTPLLVIDGQKYVLSPYVYVESTEYADPVVNFSYSDAAATGGSLSPKSVSYYQDKTEHLSDGTTRTTRLSSGATLSYSDTDSLTEASTGYVIVPSSTVESRHKVTTVTLSVTLNGKTGTKAVDVYQSAYSPKYNFYIGQMSKTAQQFTALSSNELVGYATLKSINSTLTSNLSVINSCVFLLIPKSHSHLTLSKFKYTSANIETDVLGTDGWNITHDDVIIDGVTYKVLGYRSGGISDIDPITFDYQITYTK